MMKREYKKIIIYISAAIYAALMLWLLFFQRAGRVDLAEYDLQRILRENLNYRPLYTVESYIRVLVYSTFGAARHSAAINLFGNIAMFLPLGFFVGATQGGKNRFLRTFLVSAAAIVSVELIQLFTMLGHCDVDDLILNLLGVTLGYLPVIGGKFDCK